MKRDMWGDWNYWGITNWVWSSSANGRVVSIVAECQWKPTLCTCCQVFGHATSKCLKKLSAALMGGEEMMRRVKNNNGKSYQGREMEKSYEKWWRWPLINAPYTSEIDLNNAIIPNITNGINESRMQDVQDEVVVMKNDEPLIKKEDILERCKDQIRVKGKMQASDAADALTFM